MARYRFIVRVLSPRDGGWVRVLGHFRTEAAAWEGIFLFWDMLQLAGDYVAVEVVRTIKFK